MLKWFLILWPVTVPAVVGLFRLFVLGPRQKYAGAIKDKLVLKKGDILLTGLPSVCEGWCIQLSNVLPRRMHHRFWTHAAVYQGNGKVWEAQPEGVIEKDVEVYLKGNFLPIDVLTKGTH